jgi:formylglycine-generating enzyme required for sulfatase activity
MGNDSYMFVHKLEKAGNDASAMAVELKKAGFEVTLARDLNYLEMLKKVDFFVSHITGGDQVVIFFAGHGVQLKTGNYLLPTDIEANSETQVERTSISLNDLMDKLSEAKASFSLVLVDACRDNPLKSNGRALGNGRGLTPPDPPKGQMVVYSASKGQQALDKLSDKDSDPNGVFTREFIVRMRKPGVRIEEMVREVQDSVEDLAKSVGHDQRPAMYNESRGNFYFFGPTILQPKLANQSVSTPSAPVGAVNIPSADPRQAATDADNLEDELLVWQSAQSAQTPLAYEAYLTRYPSGKYASAAGQDLLKAQQRLSKQEEDKDWLLAQNGDSAGLESFLSRYPAGTYLTRAKARLLEVRRFELAMPAGKVLKECKECPEMVVIPNGSFRMGSESADDEQPLHEVKVKRFAIGKTPVTMGEWQEIMGPKVSAFHPSSFHAAQCPVDSISWIDAQDFIHRLNEKTGKNFRLPSEAEWEYACRGGTNSRYCGSDNPSAIAWFGGKTGEEIHPVATKQPNAYGVYDMNGNVSQWVEDWYHDDYQNAPTDGSAWISSKEQPYRVQRGGDLFSRTSDLRYSARFWQDPNSRSSGNGFRLAMTLNPP